MNTMPLVATMFKKSCLENKFKGYSQGHKVNDFGVIQKGFFSWTCMHEVSISHSSKVVVKFKVDNRQIL